MLSPERQSALMSKIANDGLTRPGIGCFIAVPMWHYWASKGWLTRNSQKNLVLKKLMHISFMCLPWVFDLCWNVHQNMQHTKYTQYAGQLQHWSKYQEANIIPFRSTVVHRLEMISIFVALSQIATYTLTMV